jgi:phage terminase small subunit
MSDANAQCAGVTSSGRRCRRRPRQGEALCGPCQRRTHAAFTPARADRIVALMLAGNTIVTAARAAGVGERTLREWLARGASGEQPYASLSERLDEARAQAEARHVTQIAQAAGEDWRAASWMLERRLRAEEQVAPAPLDTAALSAQASARARAEAQATLAAIGEPLELNAGAVERYAAAVAAWECLEAQWQHAGRPGSALGGATGQAQVPHPLLAQIAQARREAAQLGTLLGLDPAGRMRLSRHVGAGRPPGAASAADRIVEPPRRRLRSVS